MVHSGFSSSTEAKRCSLGSQSRRQNLRDAIGWNAFLWKNRRHWAVVLQPALGALPVGILEASHLY